MHGPRVQAKLRGRYTVALVDEFQDTDPVQWDILQLGFGGSNTTLVLIGDPKQAIYAFRGADVYAYLAAAEVAGRRATLAVNWRSDQGLIDAYDALLRGARLGHEGITYLPVRAAAANQAPRLIGAPVAAPLRLRVLHREDGLVTITPKQGLAQVGPLPGGHRQGPGRRPGDPAVVGSAGAAPPRRRLPGRRRGGPARPRGGPRPHQPAGQPGAGGAGRRRHHRRHQRRRQRVLHAGGPGVAAAAGGPGAAHVGVPGPVRGPDRLPRLGRPAPWRRPATTPGSPSTSPSTGGPACCAATASPRSSS